MAFIAGLLSWVSLVTALSFTAAHGSIEMGPAKRLSSAEDVTSRETNLLQPSIEAEKSVKKTEDIDF